MSNLTACFLPPAFYLWSNLIWSKMFKSILATSLMLSRETYCPVSLSGNLTFQKTLSVSMIFKSWSNPNQTRARSPFIFFCFCCSFGSWVLTANVWNEILFCIKDTDSAKATDWITICRKYFKTAASLEVDFQFIFSSEKGQLFIGCDSSLCQYNFSPPKCFPVFNSDPTEGSSIRTLSFHLPMKALKNLFSEFSLPSLDTWTGTLV